MSFSQGRNCMTALDTENMASVCCDDVFKKNCWGLEPRLVNNL